MQQEFRPPFKVVLLAGVLAHGALKLVHGGQRITKFLIEFPGQPMRIGVVVLRQQFHDLRVGAGKITASFESEGNFVVILRMIGFEFRGLAKWRNRVCKPIGAEIELAVPRRARVCSPPSDR